MDRGRVQHALRRLAADLARGQGLVGELLHHIDPVAVGAQILVDRHCDRSISRAAPIHWHSRVESAKNRRAGYAGPRPGMRIAIVTDYYYPMLGGITEHVHGQARELARRGHEVTVVTGHLLRTPPIADQDARPVVDEGFEVVRLGVGVPLYGNASQTIHTVPAGLVLQLQAPLQAARRRRRAPARALQPEHVRDRAPGDPEGRGGRRHLPLRLRSWRPARRLRAHPAPLARQARCARGRLRGLHRLARSVFPVQLPHHPERHRRPALLARRRAAARAARGRQAADPLPGPLRPAQWTADDARSVRAGTCRTRGSRAPVRRRRRAAGQRLPAQAPRARGRRCHLGRARRLVAPALLRVGRHPLHALPARVVRHGAARGHEQRASRRRQPHLGLPVAHGTRQAGPHGEPGRRRESLRAGAAVPARPARRAGAHGSRGAHDRRPRYAWSSVAVQLEQLYAELLAGKRGAR